MSDEDSGDMGSYPWLAVETLGMAMVHHILNMSHTLRTLLGSAYVVSDFAAHNNNNLHTV